TGLVVDDDRLAQMLGGRLGDGAHDDIGGAAGRPRHHHRDRLGRIGLAPGHARRHGEEPGNAEGDKATASDVHSVPMSLFEGAMATGWHAAQRYSDLASPTFSKAVFSSAASLGTKAW